MKKTLQTKLRGFWLFALFLTVSVTWGQMLIPATGTTYTQNFNSMSGSTLPAGFTINGSGSVTRTASTLNGSSAGGSYRFDNGSDAAIGVLHSGSYSGGGISLQLRNTSSDYISGFTITWNYEKYRSGTRAYNATFSGGTDGDQAYAADSSTGTQYFPPQQTPKSVTITGLNIAPNGTHTVSWSITGVGGSSNAQALGIDDVTITAIPAASSLSTIIRNTTFAETQNIDYATYQATDITATNSLVVGSFDIVDGGGTNDADSSPTIVTAVNFTVQNFANIRKLALYDGTTEKAEISLTNGTAAFSNFGTLSAPDNGSKNFTLRATFKDAVTDNQQLRFTVASATVQGNGSSKFAASNAGGAATAITTNANRIEVTADRFAFTQQPTNTQVDAAMVPAVALRANDALGNLDLDFVSDVHLTSTGTLSATVTVTAAAGVATFGSITHSVSGNGLVLTATSADNAITANTNTFNVIPFALTLDSVLANNKVYDATTAAELTHGSLTGVNPSHDVSIASYVATFDNENIGTAKPVTASIILGGADAGKYAVAPITGLSADITPKEVTIAGITISDRDFNGSTSATITGTPEVSGAIAGDDVAVDATAAVAEFTNPGPGGSIPVNVSGYVLTGSDATNYTLVQPQGLTAHINDTGLANQTITFNPLSAVTYGDPSITLNATATSGLEVSFISSDENIATISGNTLTITGAGTVTITAQQTGDATHNPAINVEQTLVVNQKALTVINAAGTTKVYDNTTTAQVTGTPFGVVGSDDVTLTGNGTFADENVGENKEITAEFTLGGTDADNYTLVQPTGITGNITPLAITFTDAVAQGKAYDTTTTATFTGTLTGVIAGDDVNYTGTGTFASANVATAIEVTSTATLTGAEAANYTLTQPTGLSADITVAQVTITAEAVSRTYDGTNVATVQNAVIASGIIGSDDVTLAETTVAGTFNTPAVAENKPVTVTFALAGAQAGNYVIAPFALTANITPALLTADVSGAAVATKVYDGNNTAQISGVVLNGLVEGETVNAVSGTFAQTNAGTEIPVTIVLTGTHIGNYTFNQPETAITGAITKKGITATAADKTKTQGAANPALTITYNGFISGQSQSNAAGFIAPAISTTAVTSSPAGMYPITLVGGSATNYEFTALNNGWLSITGGAASGNILAWDFTGETALDTSDAEVKNANMDSSVTLTRGADAAPSLGANSFRTTGFGQNGIIVTRNDYFQFETSASTGYQMSISTINAVCRGTTTFGASVQSQFAYSTDGTNFTLIGSPVVTTNGGGDHNISVNTSGVTALQNVPAGTTITFRYFASGSTGTGGWGYYSSGVGNYGLALQGAVVPVPVLPNITSALTASSNVLSPATYQITATGTPSVTFTAANLPTGASINNSGLISFDGTTPAGIYTIDLTATSYYGTSNKTLVYTVNKLNQVLTFDPDPIPAQMVGNEPFLFDMNNTAGLPVSWSSSDETVVTIAVDGTITIVGAGTATITASNDGNEIYNPVTETRTITVGAPCFEWTGAVNNSWTNAGNWCAGVVPNGTRDVTIAVSDNNPVISSGTAFAKNLTVNAGATLTIATGATLSVEEVLTVATDGTLTVEDNGALLQGESATANNNSGAINFIKKSSPLYRLDYAIWASPVAGQQLQEFSPATSATRFYWYNPVTGAYKNITADNTFETAKGYLIRMPNASTETGYNTGDAAIKHNGIFNGVPNNGNINLALNNTGDRYNSVGNPYPSPISITEFFTANAGVLDISSGLYLWRKRNNGDNSSYATITLSAYVANPAEGGGSEFAEFFDGDNSTWTLAAGQGFLVRALANTTNPELHFTNSMRTASPGANQAIFRQAAPVSASTAPSSRLWLNLKSTNGSASQTAVAYMSQGTEGIDYGYDAVKLLESTLINIYTMAGETPLAIQTKPDFTTQDIVPVGYVVPVAGTYTINLGRAQGVFESGQNIYLKDNLTNTLTNITEGDYSFVTEAGTINNRFEVMYTNGALDTDNPVLNADTVVVFKQGKAIQVNSGNAIMDGITVYDISGRKLHSVSNINNTEATISNLTAEQQVLIIEISTAKGKVSKRIIY